MTAKYEAEAPLSTARALGLFAQELATFEEIPSGAIHDLVVIVGRALTEGGELAVKRSV